MAPSLVILQGILAHFGFRRAWYLGAALTPLLQVDDESTLSARPNPDTERGGRVLWLRHEDRATGTDPTTPADLVLIALYYGICGERRNWGRALERVDEAFRNGRVGEQASRDQIGEVKTRPCCKQRGVRNLVERLA
jgi:hypothetical protein